MPMLAGNSVGGDPHPGRLAQSSAHAGDPPDEGVLKAMADGIVKKRTYVAPPQQGGVGAAALSIDESLNPSAGGISNRRALVTLAADVIALAITMLLALILLPVIPHLPVFGRALADFAEVRPPLLAILC